MKNICIYCSSSEAVPESYKELTRQVSKKLAQKSYNMVYGGANTGLMGIAANTAKEAGAEVIGVIPKCITKLGVSSNDVTIHECEDLRDRKAKMDELSDAFLTLPGGLGTLEELLEILNLKFLQCHTKPIIILNPDGFFDSFIKVINDYIERGFTSVNVHKLYSVAQNVEEVFEQLENYEIVKIDKEFYKRARG